LPGKYRIPAGHSSKRKASIAANMLSSAFSWHPVLLFLLAFAFSVC
jgi:hypothetical protein